jgi:beta-glucosidase
MNPVTFEEGNIKKELFGADFKWGVSTAAYQIEGGYNADGKGHSIWDEFTRKKKKLFKGQSGNIACDFYSRYPDDLTLLKELNIPNFRFSVSWPRIFPSGSQHINQKGLDYYNRVIDHCLALDIVPWMTLYHWDLPNDLELKGGWTNRDIISWFSEYVAVCASSFGDRVTNWIVMNEPMAFVGAGYFLGLHAPGRTGLKNFLPAVHHAVLCMSAGGNILRSELLDTANIGTTFSCSHIEPATDNQRDILAATRVDAMLNRLFPEPVLGLGYPVEDLPVLKGIEKYVRPDDDSKMMFDFDFIGLQNYTREIVRHSFFTPYLKASLVKAEKRKVPLTAMKWEVYPPSIYHIIRKFDAYPAIRKILITENGAAFHDTLVGQVVNDTQRIKYLQDHIAQVLKAKSEGCKVEGYFIWTLTDNFEWAEGYHPRFGLIYVNFDTQERIIKQSGYWVKEFLSSS